MKEICVVNLQNPVHLTQTANISMQCLKSIYILAISFEYEKLRIDAYPLDWMPPPLIPSAFLGMALQLRMVFQLHQKDSKQLLGNGEWLQTTQTRS